MPGNGWAAGKKSQWKSANNNFRPTTAFPCRRRSPEGPMWSRRKAACRCPTGSVSPTSDLRESHPLVSSTPLNQTETLFTNNRLMSHRPKDPVANGQKCGSDGKKTVCQKRALEDPEGTTDTLSKNKQKKRSRNPHKNFCSEQKRESSCAASLAAAGI